DDARRSAIMPINRKYPLASLMSALRAYPMPPRRRITIEYTLIRGVNDSRAEAEALAKLLASIPAKVNLIPMNPVADSPLDAPPRETVQAFQDRLLELHVPTFVRTQRGDDIAAACGQLALAGEPRKVKVRLPAVR
ncbi:MAG: 23S rRNA (adenine(2503)-C(2))-methyltransferase RlmN, partial [Myxococcota bacterium]